MKYRFYSIFSFIGEYALYGLLFSLCISNGMVESFAGFMLLGFVGRKIIKPDFSYLRSWPNKLILFVLFFGALSLFNSGQYFGKSLYALLGKWVQYAGIFFVTQDTVRDQRIFKRSIYVFLFGASLAVFSGLSQHFIGVEFLRNKVMVNTNRGVVAVTSSFSHYNDFGSYLVIVLSLLLALLFNRKMSKAGTYGLLILAISSITAVFLTLSRGSWTALVVSFSLLAVLSGKGFKRLIPVFLVIIIIFLFPAFRERLLFVFKEGGDSDRFRIWLAAWRMIREHPFIGMGVGTFMANFPNYLPGATISYAHNCYLQIWAETGIFSLVAFLAFIVSFAYAGVKKFLASGDSLLLGLLAGAAGFLTHSFFDTNLYSLRLAVLFWSWAALILARSNINELR